MASTCSLVPLAAEALQAGDLGLAHDCIVDVQHLDSLFIDGAILIDANDDLLSGVNAGLGAGGRFLDAILGNARLNGLRHPPQFFDLANMLPGATA